MNAKIHNIPTRRSVIALALAFFIPVASATAQTLLIDDFPGTSLNTSLWTFGSSGGAGSAAVSDGKVTLSVGRTNNGSRAVLASKATDFNPFAQKLTVNLGGINVGGDPGASSFNALYAVVGRAASDTGGALTTNSQHVDYVTGGTYGAGGALGVSVQKYASAFRLEILDSGSDQSVRRTQVLLSEAPTDIIWEIDGVNSTWTVTLVGTTFDTLTPLNDLGAILSSDHTSLTGTFSNFTVESLTVGESIISRLVLGAENGSGITSWAEGVFGSVSVTATAIPEPSTYALLSALLLGAGAMVARRNRNRC